MSHQSPSLNRSDNPPPYQTATTGGNIETNTEKTIGSGNDIDITCAAKGYEDGLRKYLEIKSEIKSSFSFWVLFNPKWPVSTN